MPWTEKLPSGRIRGMYRTTAGEKRSVGTFDHAKQAFNEAAAAEALVTKPGWRDPKAAKETWGNWCIEWWPTRDVAPGTLKVDAGRRDGRLIPKWGDVQLAAITRHEVKVWVAELRADGLAPATVQRIVHLLSASLTAAVDAEILPTNPAYRLRLSPAVNAKERYLTLDEQSRLLEQLDEGSVDRALVTLLLGTGLRWGEAVGLTVNRVDLERSMIRVAEVWDNKMRAVKNYPKGKRRRDVPIPAWVTNEIRPLIGKRKTGFVFHIDGNVVDYSNWRNRTWTPALVDAGIDDLTIHDLRHTYASMLVQSGVSLEEIGRLLGHVSPLTTQRYSHLAKTPTAAVMAALQDPYAPRKSRSRNGRHGADVGQDVVLPASNVLQFVPREMTE